MIRFTVDPDGVPSHITILHPAGIGVDEDAVAYIEQSHYIPAMKDGKPIAVDGDLGVRIRSASF